MKVIYKDAEEPGNWLTRAKELERSGELDKAAIAFEKVIRRTPLNQYAYDRLMIIYRNNKEYKKEKATIVAGIKAFEQFYKKNSKLTITPKIAALSKAILRASGLADKTGELLNNREPLRRWHKRKQGLEKKLKR